MCYDFCLTGRTATVRRFEIAGGLGRDRMLKANFVCSNSTTSAIIGVACRTFYSEGAATTPEDRKASWLMGFYVRKSVRVGPLRFNLSGSGVGVSSGIPGFRVGVGPAGTYVHVGRGGLYYRQTLSPPSRLAPRRGDRAGQPVFVGQASSHTHGPMNAVGSGCVSQMVDSSSTALLAEIQRKRLRFVFWPLAILASLAAGVFLLMCELPVWLTVPCIVLLIAAVVIVFQYDCLKKSVVLMYDVDDSILPACQGLHAVVAEMSRCGAMWCISAQGDVYDPKYHAGAGQLVNRRRVSASFRDPPYVKTNVAVPVLPVGQKTLYFLPDRVLVYAANGIGAISYCDLQFSAKDTKFIEEGSVPHDAKVVDKTWRYVNKGGGPDRRFNNNRELPVCLYEELDVRSTSGLREVLQLSRIGLTQRLKVAIGNVASAVRKAESAEPARRSRENRERETLQAEAAMADSKRLAGNVRAGSPVVEGIHTALLEIVCCVMVADGRATAKERSAIRDVMKRVDAGWSPHDHDEQVMAFIEDVRKCGFSAVLNRVVNRVSIFKEFGCEHVLTKAVDLVGNIDGKKSERVRKVCERILDALNRTA